jgi:hypothetical protein
VPSVDELAASIRAAIDQSRDLIAGLDASREQATELRDALGALGVEAKAAQATLIVDSLEVKQAEASAITAGLESALAAVEAIRSGTAGGGGGSAPPGPPLSPTAPLPRPLQPGPDLARAEFDDRKLTKYALNPEHPVGGNKARVIKSRTGLGLNDAAEVKRQILEKAPAAEPIMGDTDEHGTRWKVDVELTGPDGTMKVRTGWIADAAGKTRLVTISFPPKGER